MKLGLTDASTSNTASFFINDLFLQNDHHSLVFGWKENPAHNLFQRNMFLEIQGKISPKYLAIEISKIVQSRRFQYSHLVLQSEVGIFIDLG